MNKLIEFSDSIRQELSMPTVLDHFGIEGNRSHFALCPFHSEDTGSLKIYDDHAYCFGCHWYGDVIKFTIDYLSLPFSKAIERLDSEFSLGLPLNKHMTLCDRLRIERKQQERKRALADRALHVEAHSAWESALWRAYAEYDKIIRETQEWIKENSINDISALPETYINALKKIEKVKEQIEEATIARKGCENDWTSDFKS